MAQRAYHREDVFIKKKIRFNNCLWNVLGVLQPSILWPGFRYFDFSLNFSSTELYFKFICSKCCFWFRVEQNTCSNWMLLGNQETLCKICIRYVVIRYVYTFYHSIFLIFNGELSLNIYSQGEILRISVFKIQQLNTSGCDML